MCELKAYAMQDGKETLLMEAVNAVRAEAGEVVLRNLFGEERRVRGVLREVLLSKSRVTIDAK